MIITTSIEYNISTISFNIIINSNIKRKDMYKLKKVAKMLEKNIEYIYELEKEEKGWTLFFKFETIEKFFEYIKENLGSLEGAYSF